MTSTSHDPNELRENLRAELEKNGYSKRAYELCGKLQEVEKNDPNLREKRLAIRD